MRERERELIAALAEGSLEDESEARELLDVSDEARSEYQLQIEALAALRGVEPVAMTDSERAALHREVWSSLRAAEAKSRSGAGIYGWSLAAAAVFVVVGLVAVLGGGLLGGGDGAIFEEASRELGAPAADMATEETMAAADTFEEAGEGGDDAAQISPVARSYLDREADRLRASNEPSGGAGLAETDEECLSTANLPGHELLAVLDESGVPGGQSYLAAVPGDEPLGPATVVSFVDSDLCELVHIAE